MGPKLQYSITFHPQTDGQSERVIQVLEDMLRSCVIDFKINWDKYVPLLEFTYNKRCYASLKMSQFEALNCKCRTLSCWMELSERKIVGPDLVHEIKEKVVITRNHLKATKDRQKTYVDLKRKQISFEVGEKIFLKVSPWKKDHPISLESKIESKHYKTL